MGHGDDGVLSSKELRTDISEIISFYEENVASGEDRIPYDCIIIAVGGVSIEQVYLELDDGGRVFDSADGEKDALLAESFENLTHQHIFGRYRPRQFPHSASYSTSSNKPGINSAQAEALRLGFAPAWFSDSVTFCGERSDAILILNQFKDEGLGLHLAAIHDDTTNDIARHISEAAGISLRRIK